jgi:hypothetical protein
MRNSGTGLYFHSRRLVVATALLVSVAACGGGSSGGDGAGSGLQPGTIAENPGALGAFKRFIVDAHGSGAASQLGLLGMQWGRLVDVHDLDPATGVSEPIFQEMVVDPTLASDGIDYRLERSPVTGRETLVILHRFGDRGWERAFPRLESGLQNVLIKGVSPAELPPFSAVPRNAALVLRFDDLLDDGGSRGAATYPGRVSSDTVLVEVGYPPTAHFQARIFPDSNHGGLRNGLFHSTRAIVDLTVTEVEGQQHGLATNARGLPAAITTSMANVALRLPTRVAPAAGQFELLTNLSGSTLSFAGGAPSDPESASLDVVRVFRSGGRTSVTGDPFNGYLEDRIAPRIVGAQRVLVGNVVSGAGGTSTVDLTFAQSACALAPRVGDLLELGGGRLAEVVQPGALFGDIASGVEVSLLAGAAVSAGSGELRTAFDPAVGHVPECFVTISPPPSGGPGTGVHPGASFELRFDEPMDPRALDTFENFALTDPSQPGNQLFGQVVVASASPSTDLDVFTLSPAFPLSHASGVSEDYDLHVLGGASGITDLAGNPLESALNAMSVVLDAAAPALTTGNLSLQFDATDENGDGTPELRGQLLFDLVHGEIAPRAVSRWSVEVNETLATAPTAMTMGAGAAVIEPLTPYGSRVMSVWRYHDLGMALLDDGTQNVDVEGLHWTPQANDVLFDHLPRFSIALGHGAFLPDESLNGGVARYPSSGLVATYSANELEAPTVVHEAHRGYTILPGDATMSPGGRRMVPYPLNRGIALRDYTYWTWRDTSLQAVAGPNGQGVDTARLLELAGGTPGLYGAGQVPTIGLPLLVETRTYPDSGILGLNLLRVLVPAPGGTQVPWFRAFSSGFVSPSGVATLVEPDQLQAAVGGLNTLGLPAGPTDLAVYQGQVDFVTRVNRAHTIWFDAGAPSSFGDAVFEPSLAELSPGTGLELAFRGATSVIDSGGVIGDATMYDAYGDFRGGPVTFLGADPTWKAALPELDGARFVQVRMTMISNAESGVRPRLSSLGIPYSR